MRAISAFNPVVIAPTFNNGRTLHCILSGIGDLGLPIIVVDDGCTDGSAGILQGWHEEGAAGVVVTHLENRGKAAALRSGFVRAAAMGFSHAVTIDTDGQLDPAEIPNLLRIARLSPAALVLGTRDARAADYPRASRAGRFWSNLGVKWASGAIVSDSQCGFRVYPLRAIERLKCRAARYGFETEILTRAAWAGVSIREVAVSCAYSVPQGRVTHFRPWRDSFAGAGMHILLLVRSIMPWPIARSVDADDLDDDGFTGTLWRRFLRWVSPGRAWRAVRQDPGERPRFAAGLALGVFIANLPLYGVQTILSLYSARRFRLNPIPVVVGSHLSTPPVGPVLIASAIAIGHWLRHGTFPALASFDPTVVGYRALIRAVLLEWAMGGVVCGAVLAMITFVIARVLLNCLPLRRPESPGIHPDAPVPIPDRAVAESAV